MKKKRERENWKKNCKEGKIREKEKKIEENLEKEQILLISLYLHW